MEVTQEMIANWIDLSQSPDEKNRALAKSIFMDGQSGIGKNGSRYNNMCYKIKNWLFWSQKTDAWFDAYLTDGVEAIKHCCKIKFTTKSEVTKNYCTALVEYIGCRISDANPKK